MGSETTETIIHLVAGGAGGTMGAILTCPFEVVKTRLQSSNSSFCPPSSSKASSASTLSMTTLATDLKGGGNQRPQVNFVFPRYLHAVSLITRYSTNSLPRPQMHSSSFTTANPWHCIKFIVECEGIFGLFKGLGPNLVGVAPARAIYFWAYSTSKRNLNERLPKSNRDTPFVHVISAGSAGFTASTMTNPIWLVKTRLQLDRSIGDKYLSVRKCISKTYQQQGIFGFWRGVTASYWGISETVIHFVIYEYLKTRLLAYQRSQLKSKKDNEKKSLLDFAGFMLCGACSKTCATIVAYPHEVARTRLREEGTKYRSFWQTLSTVYHEEGRPGLYRGLTTQLIRQIPNTAIMMATYELSVYFMRQWIKNREAEQQRRLSSAQAQKFS